MIEVIDYGTNKKHFATCEFCGAYISYNRCDCEYGYSDFLHIVCPCCHRAIRHKGDNYDNKR